MKNLSYAIFIALMIASQLKLNAQDQMDALRYSFLDYSGTARFNAMGGAFTSLGGDYSGVNINPAGLGLYRSSELSISPSFLFSNTKSTYEKQNNSEGRLNFNLGNLSYVNYVPIDKDGWKSLNFSVGYSRTNSFNNEYSYKSNVPSTNSLIDGFVSQLNNTNDGNSYIPQNQISNIFPSDVGLAYNSYLIDSVQGGGYDVRFYDASDIGRAFKVVDRGGMGDIDLSLGANYQDKLYLGGSIGFSSVRFKEKTTYKETMSYNTQADSASAVDFPRTTDYTRTTHLDVSGSGINLKFGFIYKIRDNIRFGAAIQSPTYLSLSETYSLNYKSNFVNNDQYSQDYSSNFDYRINTPWRVNAGIGFIIQKRAIVSADYEYVNYPKAKLKDAYDAQLEYGFEAENNSIENDFSKAHNLRFGIEYKINDPFSVRAGFKYNDNPLNNSINDDLSSKVYSAGIGYKSVNGFFIDAAYSLMQQNRNDYIEPQTSTALLTKNNHLIQFTVGLRY